MLRLVVALSCLSVAFAGCASKEGEAPVAPSPTFVVTAAPMVDTTPRTDTLHLLDPPHLAGSLPEGNALIRTAIPSDLSPSGAPPAWRFIRPNLPILDASVHLWVDVQGVVTNYGQLASGGCFWIVAFRFEGAQTASENIGAACLPEEAVVATGIRELVVDLPPADVQGKPGARLELAIGTYGNYAPGATVDLLSGAVEYDSTITLEGLQLPLDTRTLLQ